MMIRGETLLITLVNGIFGCVSQKNYKNNLDVYFAQLKRRQILNCAK